MAGTITHSYFALDMYDKLSIKSKELLIENKDELKVYSQSNDVLFINSNKKIRKFASYFHEDKTYIFFETLINYIKYNDYMYNPSVMAYLYGMLSHYVLDSSIHPYVYYKCGKVKKDIKETYKYDGLHAKLENYFDNYLVAIKDKINPIKYKSYKLFDLKKLDKDLKEVIDFTYKEVFGIENFSKIYLKAVKQNKRYYHLFKYDPYKIKIKVYKLIDIITPKKISRIENLSHASKNDKSLLNLAYMLSYLFNNTRYQNVCLIYLYI